MHKKIPIIRKMMPSMVAMDIVGVQPLASPTGQIFSMRQRSWETNIRHIYEETNNGRTEYIVSCAHYKITEMFDWCFERFGPLYGLNIETTRWLQYGLLFSFSNEADRAWFILRWTDE
jgi:hypothetical protein